RRRLTRGDPLVQRADTGDELELMLGARGAPAAMLELCVAEGDQDGHGSRARRTRVSALAERELLRLDDRLEQVLEERLLAGMDVHGRSHAGNDRQRLAMALRHRAAGPHAHEVVALAF